jgi:hypothetical protein
VIGSVFAFLAGCGSTSSSSGGSGGAPSEGGNGSGASSDAAFDAAEPAHLADGGSDASGEVGEAGNDGGGAVDAGPPVDLDGGTTFVVAQPISGTPSPTKVPLQGPGVFLMGGGTDVDAAFVWMHDTLAGSSTAKLGNIVVFNTQTPPPSIDNAYTARFART